jgi:drug/metabolite transporter (DMT)-like permease
MLQTPPLMKRHSAAEWLMLASLVVAWGSSFAMTKVAVTSISASWTMALRLCFAAAILLPFAALTGRSLRISQGDMLRFSYLALTGYALPFFLISWGTGLIPSGIAGLLMGAIPLFMVIAAHLFLANDRLTLPRAIGFIFGFAGIIVLMGEDAVRGLAVSGDELLGELAVLLGCLLYVAHGIGAKRFGVQEPIRQTALICGIAAIMGVVMAVVLSPGGLSGMPPAAWLATLGLGLIPTAFASVVMYVLIERSGPTFTTLSNYLVPIFAVLLGAALFGEQLDWTVLLSLTLVLTGIAISRMKWSGRDL